MFILVLFDKLQFIFIMRTIIPTRFVAEPNSLSSSYYALSNEPF